MPTTFTFGFTILAIISAVSRNSSKLGNLKSGRPRICSRVGS